jgi:dihydrofolate synthase / folylpolyglutamate synthase
LDFDEALTWLDDHLDRERTPAVAGRIKGLSLEPMRRIAHVLGDPQHAYPVVHLTGTNGKGSTARMVSALLAAHDLSVGTYTSPHLEHVVERIAWNLQPIDPDDLARVITELATLEPLMREELRGVSTKLPSYFELLTAAAYAWFAEVAVDVAVVEVGMLGAWDATNVADARVAVITNVGKDHTNAQGDWRRRIAEEKSGIVDPGSQLILGETDPLLLPVFEARESAGTWLRDRDFGAAGGAIALGGRVADLWTPHGRYDEVFVPLHGAHQIDNAACAVAAVEALFDRALDADLVREAFADVTLPGRFEVLHRGPLLVLDGAHNADGAAAAARTLADEFSVSGRRRWVLGMLAGRDIDEILDAFGIGGPDHADDQVIACNPGVAARAVPADELAAHLTKRGVDVEVLPDVAEALAYAWTDATAAGENDLVMVTGSLYTIGEARTASRRLGLL